jgi:cytochrome P450
MAVNSAQAARPDDYDPLGSDDPAVVRATFDELRMRRPLAHSSAYGGFWTLTRYEDVRAAASDSTTFISSVTAVVPSDPRGLRRPPLNYDAPAHTPYRRALDRTLQRSRLDRLEPRLWEHARRELQPMLDNGGGDIAQEYGVRFPAWLTTEWLNLPAETAPQLAETSFRWVTAWREQDRETVNTASESMYEIAWSLLRSRKESPLPVEEDPASSLLAERVDGEPLLDENLVGALRQCLVVGMVAPPILLGSVTNHLSEDQELQDRLRCEPELIPAAVEEFVRLYSPYRGFARTVSEPTTLHGEVIEPRQPIALAYAAANRDPEFFEAPNEFRLDRENIHQHLGFGRGRHRCAGMPLARLGITIALSNLLQSTSSFRVVGPTPGARMPEVGLTSVPLKMVPAAS